jgi:hypothetical protein
VHRSSDEALREAQRVALELSEGDPGLHPVWMTPT